MQNFPLERTVLCWRDKTVLVRAHFLIRRNVRVLLAKWSDSLSQMRFLDLRKPHMI